MWPQRVGEEVGNQPPPPFLGLTAREDSSIADSGFIAGTGGEVQSGNDSPRLCITTGTRDHAQDHANSVREERNRRRRALLQPNKMRCTKHRPPEGSLYALLPRHQSGLSRALRLSPACLPSPRLGPQVSGSLQGASSRVAGTKASGRRYCQAPGRAPS